MYVRYMQNKGERTWHPGGKSMTVRELAPAYNAASSELRTSGCLMKNDDISSITSSHRYRSTDSTTFEKSFADRVACRFEADSCPLRPIVSNFCPLASLLPLPEDVLKDDDEFPPNALKPRLLLPVVPPLLLFCNEAFVLLSCLVEFALEAVGEEYIIDLDRLPVWFELTEEAPAAAACIASFFTVAFRLAFGSAAVESELERFFGGLPFFLCGLSLHKCALPRREHRAQGRLESHVDFAL
mmetsp:Transcript_19070/g.31071  ORF Transcript_19070/g.31071 Transcript_19070/m.31071 type:complete len:241 (+) Transcript_19070:1235-1957(+)